jgi:hypothetical protein
MLRRDEHHMTESTLVRIAIILYAAFALSALVLLWRNAAASDALKNAGILVAAILPVLIAVLPYIIVQEENYRFNFILLYDSKDKTLTTGDDWNPYASLYMHMFTNLSKASAAMIVDNLLDFEEKKGLDIIEKDIVEALILRFPSHWDVVWHEWRGPNYLAFSGGKGTIEASKQISLEEIRKAFSHNLLISTPGILVRPGFHIPPDSTLKATQPDKSRIIIIITPYSTASISVRFSSLAVAQHGVWGVLKADPQNPDRYYSIEYAVSLTIRPKRFKKYAPEMGSYSRWHENIRKALQVYDWESVDRQIDQSKMREAASKITDKESE